MAKPCPQRSSSKVTPFDLQLSDETLFGKTPLFQQNRQTAVPLAESTIVLHCRFKARKLNDFKISKKEMKEIKILAPTGMLGAGFGLAARAVQPGRIGRLRRAATRTVDEPAHTR